MEVSFHFKLCLDNTNFQSRVCDLQEASVLKTQFLQWKVKDVNALHTAHVFFFICVTCFRSRNSIK